MREHSDLHLPGVGLKLHSCYLIAEGGEVKNELDALLEQHRAEQQLLALTMQQLLEIAGGEPRGWKPGELVAEVVRLHGAPKDVVQRAARRLLATGRLAQTRDARLAVSA